MPAVSEFSNIESSDAAVSVSQDDITTLKDSIGLLDGKLDNINDAVNSADAVSIDYSDTLNNISQLLVMTDVLLVIVAMLLFLACGMFFGYQVTRMWRNG